MNRADAIDGAIAQLLEAFAEESACSRSVTRLLADADQRLALMEANCAEAIEQAVAMSEDRGRLLERQWVLDLVGMLLDGLQEGAGVVALQSLRRMVEEGPLRQDGPTMQIDAND